jgi:hypothetical protein
MRLLRGILLQDLMLSLLRAVVLLRLLLLLLLSSQWSCQL